METLRYGVAPPDVRTILGADFEFTANPNDWVATEDLLAYLRKQMTVTDHAVSRLLTTAGFPSKTRRIGARVIRIRTGLKPLPGEYPREPARSCVPPDAR